MTPPVSVPSEMRPLLEITGLEKHFGRRGGWLRPGGKPVRAVDGVSFAIRRGETFGLVGESGCGKSSLGRLLVRLLSPTAGSIDFDGIDLATLSGSELRATRRRYQMVFQDPVGSFNPRMNVRDIVAEPLDYLGVARAARRTRALEAIALVGLQPDHAARFPHQFSGGQRQRIGIARALVVSPEFLVLDEPVSALDVSIQAQIVNLLKDLQQRLSLTQLFISHDLRVVRHMADRVAVMYLGQIVELAEKADLFATPRHPYTRALLAAVPAARPGMARDRSAVRGEPASPTNPPSGCRYRTRCPHAMARCADEMPVLIDRAPGHRVACHLDA